jgi:hypothetical protein
LKAAFKLKQTLDTGVNVDLEEVHHQDLCLVEMIEAVAQEEAKRFNQGNGGGIRG